MPNVQRWGAGLPCRGILVPTVLSVEGWTPSALSGRGGTAALGLPRRLRSGRKISAEEAEAARAVVELTINGISGGLKNTG